MTRDNSARLVMVFKFNSFIKTNDGVVMIPNLLQKFAALASRDLFRSNLMLSVMFSFGSTVTLQEAIYNSRLLISYFFRICQSLR